MSNFWILVIVALLGSIILLAVDYSNSVKDKKSRTTLLWGAGISFAAAFLGIWGLNNIPVVVIHALALLAFLFFARYLTRLAANRKQ